MKKNVLVLIPVSESHKLLFKEKGTDCTFTYSSRDEVDISQIHDANIIIGNPPMDMVKTSSKLEWLQLGSAGVGSYIEKGVLPEKAILTNASGAYGLAISEHMLGVLLSLYKNLYIYRDNQSASNWSYAGPVKSIYKTTALIVGLGDIGGEFAKRLKALGAYTFGIRRTNKNKPEYIDELYMMNSFIDVLPTADVVALCLPETKSTKKIINRETLKLMKKDAVIINIGRGSAIDTEALCDALENGEISGAALDVTDPEPLPCDHRLWKLKNAIITPHVSGGYSLKETHERIVNISANNLEAFLSGKDLKNVVNFSEGY